MKYASGGMISLLNAGGPYTMADCYTVTLQGGSVFRWTNADINLTLGGNLFTCSLDQGSQPLVQRGAIRNVRGTEVQTMDLTLITAGSAQLMGVNMSLAAHNGAGHAGGYIQRVRRPL